MLRTLCEEYWEGHLRAHPEDATMNGDRRFDDRLTDLSPEGRAAEGARIEDIQRRVREIPAESLTPEDALTRRCLLDVVQNRLAHASCLLETWVVDPIWGPQTNLQNLASTQTVTTPGEGRAMVERWRAMGTYLDQHVGNLRSGMEAGRVAMDVAISKVLRSLDLLLETPLEEWALLGPVREEHPGWTDEERTAFRDDLTAAVRDVARPAFRRYRDFLRDELLPRARPPEKPGLVHLPGGLDAYRKLIEYHTSLDTSPEELHRIGKEEVARIRKEMSVLGGKLFGMEEVPAILQRVRTDPEMHFSTRDEVEAKAKEATARASAAIPEWFGILPRTPCTAERFAPHEETNSLIAYYRPPAQDGSRPGTYMVNTSAPETRPRYEAEVLAFHEGIPGHHLQIALAQEIPGVPEFRRHMDETAFVEGWALYSERLADEMGLYSSDLDRLGILSFDAWRACRLVVDTGMHAMGWTRQQAIDYMRENSAIAESNVVVEIDRYITWPGQALAYKVGQLEILKLRADMEARLGEAFDIQWFHDRVLENGAVSLAILRERMEEAAEDLR
jgi:uncharacterized protein (DUF885 family)